MAQHDYNIANQTAANARTDINNVLSAIATNNSGTSAPSTTFANQWWYDTDAFILYIRANGNDAWIPVAYLDQTNDRFRILEDTQVVNTSGTFSGILGGQATGTWETGTGGVESLISPAKLKAAIVAQPTVTIVRGSTSTNTTALTHTVTHGQGSRPDHVWGEIIITTAQNGYAVGDCIKLSQVFERDEDDVLMAFWGNSTHMGLSTNTYLSYMETANRNTGADQRLTGQSIRVCGVWYD